MKCSQTLWFAFPKDVPAQNIIFCSIFPRSETAGQPLNTDARVQWIQKPVDFGGRNRYK